MGVSSRRLFGFLARLACPPADSDADLLDRFVRSQDEAAFAAIVRRHGPMVLGVCLRRLGREADAEDAFQATFLALARSASSIARRESLPGWLYRVAYLVSLKAAGRRARHPLTELPAEVPMPDPPTPSCEAGELRAILEAELAALPDKFRSVLVLCIVEGRTNAEAATVLGVPVGTVDSRLSTARKKLQVRLTRRGLGVGAGLSLEQLLGGSAAAAEGPGFDELITHTIRLVLADTAGTAAGSVPPAVTELAQGVTTMTTNVRFLAAVALTLGILGGAGAGIYLAAAADPPQPADAATANTPARPDALRQQAPAGDPAQAGGKATAAALDKPLGGPIDAGLPIGEFLMYVEKETELVVRVDVAAFRRIGVGDAAGEGPLSTEQLLNLIYDSKAVFPRRAEKFPIRDLLGDTLAQVPTNPPCTYQVRGSQLVIVPAYVPPVRPGVNPLDPIDDTTVDARIVNEQIYGGVVNVSADRKPLAEILADLRKQTGANIVLDPRCETPEKKPTLTVTLSDVRLYDALRVIADMAELKMVYAGNIYYVTTAANAKAFQPPLQP